MTKLRKLRKLRKYIDFYLLCQVLSILCMTFAIYLSIVRDIQMSTHFIALAIFLQVTAGEEPSKRERELKDYHDTLL